MSIMEIINEAAQADWESYHGHTDDDYIPQVPPSFMRGFLCGVAWATQGTVNATTTRPTPTATRRA